MAAAGFRASEVVPTYYGRADSKAAAMAWVERVLLSTKHIISLPRKSLPQFNLFGFVGSHLSCAGPYGPGRVGPGGRVRLPRRLRPAWVRAPLAAPPL